MAIKRLEERAAIGTISTRLFGLPTVAATPFNSAKHFTKTSVRMPGSKAKVPKQIKRTAPNNDYCDNIVGESEIWEVRIQ